MKRLQIATLSGLVIAVTWWLAYAGQILKTEAAPNGIVSFELAGNAAASAAIMSSWIGGARDMALLVQGVDYLYLLIYPLWFNWACGSLGRHLGGAWKTSGFVISVVALVAAPLDAIENYALIKQLLNGPSDSMAALAYWTALPKFGAVVLAAAFVVAALCRAGVERLTR